MAPMRELAVWMGYYKEISPVFEQDIYEAISMKTCVEKRETYGAPGPKVMEQIIVANKEYLKNN